MSEIDRQGAKLAKRLSQPINTAAIVIMGVYTTLWGVWVGNPFWSTFAESKQYDWLGSVMPEWGWGASAAAVGVVMIYGVMRNSFRSLSIGSFIGSIYWGLIAMGYYIGDWRDTAGLTKTMICLYCAFIFLNIKMNRDRLVD
jgi:hypothetical protein